MARVTLTRPEANEGLLPPVCMRCGAASELVRSKKFSWSPSWVFVLLFCGIIPFILVAILTSKKMRVLTPLCAAHRSHWSRVVWFAFTGIGIVLAMVTVAILVHDPSNRDNSATGNLAVGALLVGFVWLVSTVIFQATRIQPVEITDRTITLIRVSPGFAEALQTARAMRPAAASAMLKEPRASSGLVAVVVVVCLLMIVCLVAVAALGEREIVRSQPFVDPARGLGLKRPGPDWGMLSESRLKTLHTHAVAGAETEDGRLGMLLVEPADARLRLAGNEAEIAKQLIAGSPLRNKTEVKSGPTKFLDKHAVYYQITGDSEQGRIRMECTLFEHLGSFVQVLVMGPAASTAEDRSSFYPFVHAVWLTYPR